MKGNVESTGDGGGERLVSWVGLDGVPRSLGRWREVTGELGGCGMKLAGGLDELLLGIGRPDSFEDIDTALDLMAASKEGLVRLVEGRGVDLEGTGRAQVAMSPCRRLKSWYQSASISSAILVRDPWTSANVADRVWIFGMSATAAARSLRRVGVAANTGDCSKFSLSSASCTSNGTVGFRAVQSGFINAQLSGVGDSGHRDLKRIELRPRRSDLRQDVRIAGGGPGVLTRLPCRNGFRAGQDNDRDRGNEDKKEKHQPDPRMPPAAVRHDRGRFCSRIRRSVSRSHPPP